MTESIRKIFGGGGGAVPIKTFHLELDGDKSGGSLFLSGINDIREFTDTVAVFRVRGFSLRVAGERLQLTVFENKSVRLDGRISGVELEYDKT